MSSTNRLATYAKRLSKYPKWVLSWAVGRAVPLVGTAGIHFEKLTDNEVILHLKNRRKTGNHIGQIHAAAMILLAETATGMVVGMNVPDDRLPLIKSIKSDFVRRSQGAMRAVAALTPEQQEMIRNTPKGELYVPVIVTDESGEQPIVCEMLWAWIPKKK